MMSAKVIFISVFLFLTKTLFGQEYFYYPTGELEAKLVFDSTCNCEKYTEYYKSGKIRSTKTYQLKLIGDNIYHYEKDELRSSKISSSRIDGEDIYYFENGDTMIYSFWKNGALDGRMYCYYSNGKLSYEKFFSHQNKEGTWRFYNEDGTLREEQIYEKGKTAWNSDLDNSTRKIYLNSKLGYTETIVLGRKTNTVINNQKIYNQIIAQRLPLGKELFVQNCSSCHSANNDIVGPKLKGVTLRRSNDWLVKMITNGDALAKSGDKEAEALYEKWNRIEHPNFERLTNEEVQTLIDYLKTLK